MTQARTGPNSASPGPDSFAFPAPLKSEEPVYPLCLTKPPPPSNA